MKNPKKLISFALLAAILAGSATGCGKSTTGSTAGNSSVPVNVTFPLAKSESFTIMTRVESDSEQDFSKKALVQRMNKLTNVNAVYQTIPDEQFDDKSKLALASNKGMPDVITKLYIKPRDILSYASKGVIIDLKPYIEKNMPNLQKVLKERPDVLAAITSSDGHIYTLPFINETSRNTKEANNVVGAVPYINTTWLKQLGLSMPTTTAELENVLKAFKAKITPKAGKVIPMSFRINQCNEDIGITLGAFGCGDDMDHYMVSNDKKVFYTLAQPEIRKGLTWMNSLYKEGLIDPEIFSQDNDSYVAKESSGRVGLFYDWSTTSAGTYANQYAALPALAGPDGTRKIPRQNYYSFDMGVTAVTKACKDPAVILAYLDKYFEPSMSIQNCFGTYDDKNYTNVFTKDANGMLEFTKEANSDYKVINNQRLYDTFAVLADYYGKYVKGMKSDDQKRVDMIKANYTPYVTNNYNYPAAFMDKEDINRIAEIETDLTPYAESVKAQIVKNGISDSDWNAYLKKLDQMGLPELLTLKQKGFDQFYKLTNDKK